MHPSPRVAHPHRDEQSRSCQYYPLRSHREGFCWTAEVPTLLTTCGKMLSLTTSLGAHWHPPQSRTTEAPLVIAGAASEHRPVLAQNAQPGEVLQQRWGSGSDQNQGGHHHLFPHANKAHLSTRYPYGRMTNGIKTNLGEYYLDTQPQSRKKSESREPLTWFHTS